MALFTRLTTRFWRIFGWVLLEFMGSCFYLFFVGIASTYGFGLGGLIPWRFRISDSTPFDQVTWFLDVCHVCAACAKILAGLQFTRWGSLDFVSSCELYIIAQTKWRWKEGSRGRIQVYYLLVDFDSYFNLNERNRKFDFIVMYWLSHLYPQNCNHPYSSHRHFHLSLRPCQILIFSALITSTLFLVCRSNDRHFYQRWFIGYQSIRHCWWVDRNWLVLVTYCSAHAPPFRCRIDDDACLRKVNGENEVQYGWRGRIWAKRPQDWNGLCSIFGQPLRRIVLSLWQNWRMSSLICWILVRLLWIPQWMDDFKSLAV